MLWRGLDDLPPTDETLKPSKNDLRNKYSRELLKKMRLHKTNDTRLWDPTDNWPDLCDPWLLSSISVERLETMTADLMTLLLGFVFANLEKRNFDVADKKFAFASPERWKLWLTPWNGHEDADVYPIGFCIWAGKGVRSYGEGESERYGEDKFKRGWRKEAKDLEKDQDDSWIVDDLLDSRYPIMLMSLLPDAADCLPEPPFVPRPFTDHLLPRQPRAHKVYPYFGQLAHWAYVFSDPNFYLIKRWEEVNRTTPSGTKEQIRAQNVVRLLRYTVAKVVKVAYDGRHLYGDARSPEALPVADAYRKHQDYLLSQRKWEAECILNNWSWVFWQRWLIYFRSTMASRRCLNIPWILFCAAALTLQTHAYMASSKRGYLQGTTADAEFYSTVQNSLMQLLGIYIPFKAYHPDELTQKAVYIWNLYFLVAGSALFSVFAIPTYFLSPPLAQFVGCCANVLQMAAALYLEVKSDYIAEEVLHGPRDLPGYAGRYYNFEGKRGVKVEHTRDKQADKVKTT